MKWYQILCVALLSSVLFACGGGSGGGLSFNEGSTDSTDSTDNTDDGADSPDATDTVTLSAVLYSCPSDWDKDDGVTSCDETIEISDVNPGTLAVTLYLNGEAVVDNHQIITATTTIGEIAVDTALTNSEGIAYFIVTSGSVLGAGRITVDTDAFEDDTTFDSADAINFEIAEAEFEITIENVLDGASLAQNATTLITANLTLNGEAYTIPVDVNFTSACAEADTSNLDETVTTSNGIAQASYQAVGCVGDDTITASTDINSLSVTTTINVASSPADSIRFISATPTSISIAGTGGADRQETSTVIFEVVDVNGSASSLQDVTFSLNNAPSGTTLSSYAGTTNSDGQVSVVVKAGSVAGPVRVQVEVTGSEPLISSISDQLSISTGLPDQDSFSFALEDHSPESLNINGVTVSTSVLLADRFNNAVPDGTTVFFNTEGGAIRDTSGGTTGSCTTSGSACSVEWVSQNPRPEGNELTDFNAVGQCANYVYAPSGFNSTGPCITDEDGDGIIGMGSPWGGRVTITAYTEGEENFVDNNGDGLFSSVDTFDIDSDDLSEVFFDDNENGSYDVGEEEYQDYNQDGSFSVGNTKYNGTLCDDATCSTDLIHVRDQQILIMASSDQYIRVQHDSADIGEVDLAPNDEGTGEDVILESYKVKAYFADIYNNRPPTGTTISVSTENGELSGQTSWVLGSSSAIGPYSIEFTLVQEESPNDKTFGTLSIELATPEGGTLTFEMDVRDAG
ncbi:Ig-like domain-containing protein [Psychromonas sp. L1A2]|uniref:Ig-like domain-containing protein n=1 Tax=Psychromonas sp. L1A2 TaxID=2686356 RepID=UPI00135A1723|nr:Ig-like domain-containing protein [Psychromonas sp. L1A2]